MAPKKKPTAEPTETDTPALAGRVICPLQSSGRMGKSTFMDLLLGWLDHAEVDWRGLDFDGVHKTLSRAYENVHLLPLNDGEAIPRLVDALAHEEPVPVTALDMPAQAVDQLIRDFDEYGIMEAMEVQRLRLTIPLFLVDDQSARESMAKVLKAFGTRADFVFVRNPVKGKSTGVEATPVVAGMIEKGTPIITLPTLTERTRDAITAVSRQEKKFFPLSSMRDVLPLGPRVELAKFVPRVWLQMEEAAAVLLPDVSLIRNRVSAVADARAGANGEEIDPYDV